MPSFQHESNSNQNSIGVKSGVGVARNNVQSYINTNEDDAGFTFEAWVYPRSDSPPT